MHELAEKGVISAAELAELLRSNVIPVKLLDGTYGGPGVPAVRIGNAVPFDIDAVADKESDMAHMLPAPEEFAAAVEEMGISGNDLVVVYDRSGIAMAAARVWWMFRVFGHDNVCVLNGGLPAWMAQGYRVETGPAPHPVPGRFQASFRPHLVKNMAEVAAAAEKDDAMILDARAPERFAGLMPEPRPGLRCGHIPGSLNLPYSQLLDPATGALLPPALLRQQLSAEYYDKSIIASCGSGVTACVLALGLLTVGQKNVAVYDGSWTEWGRESSCTPIALTA